MLSLRRLPGPCRLRTAGARARAGERARAAGAPHDAASDHGDGAEGAGGSAERAGQRHRGAGRDARGGRRAQRQRRRRLRAEHVLQRVHGAEAEQRAVSRRRLEPEQPGRHHLHRRRAAAQRELVEPRAARHRADRLRARAAERALRAQRARRRDQHHAAAGRRSRPGRASSSRAVRQLRHRPTFAAPRPVPLVADKVAVGFGARLLAARRLHDERRHRQRHRFAIGRLRQGSAAVAPGGPLGSAGDAHDGARARRRLRAERRRRAPGEPVPRLAQRRGVHPPRHRRADRSRDARRPPRRCLLDRPAS